MRRPSLAERESRTTCVCTCCASLLVWISAEPSRTSRKLPPKKTHIFSLFALYFQKPQIMDQVNVTRKSTVFFFLTRSDLVYVGQGGSNSYWTLRKAVFTPNASNARWFPRQVKSCCTRSSSFDAACSHRKCRMLVAATLRRSKDPAISSAVSLFHRRSRFQPNGF